MEWLWLFIFVILLLFEGLTFNLITIWFAVGALGAFISAYITTDVVVQCLVFAIITTISLVMTRPLVKKMLKNSAPVKTNLDLVVGATGIVEKEISSETMGRVIVLGKNWLAKSSETIKAGSKVEILAIEGAKLIVKKKEEE